MAKFFSALFLNWLLAKLLSGSQFLYLTIQIYRKGVRDLKDIQKKADAYDAIIAKGKDATREERRSATEDVLNSGDT